MIVGGLSKDRGEKKKRKAMEDLIISCSLEKGRGREEGKGTLPTRRIGD